MFPPLKKGMTVVLEAPFDTDYEKDHDYKYHLFKDSFQNPVWIAKVVRYYGDRKGYADLQFFRSGGFNVLNDQDTQFRLDETIYRVSGVLHSCIGTLRNFKGANEISEIIQKHSCKNNDNEK